ncbi:hypothetical protein QWZ06_09380 [Chryseobacterium tructae]|uniref:Uncharacterized protein n=1 Tax=Chryseobacterium tructae TaxID=1037380 RepID=A0ABV7XW79_9FLAO|nr:hypothetical protein [Chryseobacterium tructae]MDN3692470.1 hypothetical protein [Chryseobacterium tructae]
MKKKLESLKLKKFKMQTVKGGGREPELPDAEDSYKAENSYTGTQYVNDTVKYD